MSRVLFSCSDHFAKPSIVLSVSVEDFVPLEAHSDLQKNEGLRISLISYLPPSLGSSRAILNGMIDYSLVALISVLW